MELHTGMLIFLLFSMCLLFIAFSYNLYEELEKVKKENNELKIKLGKPVQEIQKPTNSILNTLNLVRVFLISKLNL